MTDPDAVSTFRAYLRRLGRQMLKSEFKPVAAIKGGELSAVDQCEHRPLYRRPNLRPELGVRRRTGDGDAA
jgi:hypothetical protein